MVFSPSIAVIGSRKASQEGLRRTKSLVRKLVQSDFTVVSGLASGIDSMAHNTALSEKGRTIAVLGTPLSHVYPRQNRNLQQTIAKYFLAVSQVPLIRYENQDFRQNRTFFAERNATMSALTDATIIVEAGETSGSLIQARAAIEQRRKLFILDNCFRNQSLAWPAKFLKLGAIRVKTFDDIAKHISAIPCSDVAN